MGKKALTAKQTEELLTTLEQRFENNMKRHKGLKWEDVQAILKATPQKLVSLSEMERTGGEPDVIALDKKTGVYIFL